MKTIIKVTIYIGLVFLIIAVSVVLSLFFFEQQQGEGTWSLSSKQQGRYQLIFGEITHTESSPSEEVGIVKQKLSVRPICFKFDTITGETWQYESDFYKDPNDPKKTKTDESFNYVDSYGGFPDFF